MLWVNQTIKIKRAAKLGGFAHAHRTTGLPRSSPTGFDKNLHPTGSIFPKNLVNRATPTFSRAFSFLFFPFFFSLLKMSVRSAASIILMACYMKTLLLKTHRPTTTYTKPHFFILNKGLNSGKPLKAPLPKLLCLPQRLPRQQRPSILDSLRPLEVQNASCLSSWFCDSIHNDWRIQKAVSKHILSGSSLPGEV